MCRFTCYLGDEIVLADLVTRPENSLINQSTHAKERPEPLNGDGFGLAWYSADGPVPGRFRSLTPAWSNANLVELARVTRGHCIMAHVRAATGGSFDVSEANCHPFRCGPFTFMHNGHIEAFDRIRRPLLDSLSDEGFASVRGTTDSEPMFALAMDRLRGHEDDADCAMLADTLEWTVTRIVGLVREIAPGTHAYLNLVLTNGHHVAACRFSTDPDYIDSLYLNQGARYACRDGVCCMDVPETQPAALLISSEPLNDGPHWTRVERNQLVLASSPAEVSFRSLDASSD